MSALLLLAAGLASAAPARSAQSTAELVPELLRAPAGTAVRMALVLRLDPGWHAYWRNPGDSGAAPILKWSHPAGETRWPVPKRLPAGPLTNFGYEGTAVLLTPVTTGGPERVVLDAEWLVCAQECVPASALLSAVVREAPAPAPNPAWGRLPPADYPFPAPQGYSAHAERDAVILEGKGASAEFFPLGSGELAAAGGLSTPGFRLRMPLAEEAAGAPARLSGVLVVDGKGYELDIPVGPAPPPPLLPALGLAFLGGLLLNLMPCVFPVLSIKVLGFLEQAGSPGRARLHGAAYGAGVVASMWALAGLLIALRASGAQVGWGFQLQSPWALGALAALFAALGFSLLGTLTLGAGLTRLAGLAAGTRGPGGAFASGTLAVVAATPCTAPFMGAALGAALALPAAGAFGVFTALAAGLALPAAALSAWPPALRLLPRPGAWMETLKEALAFPLFATAAWLAGILGRMLGAVWLGPLAWGASGLGLAAWLGRRSRLAGAAAVVVTAAFLWPRQGDTLPWQPWSEARLHEAMASGQGAFVDFTAEWCVTCQVNERVAMRHPEGRKALLDSGLVLLKADWTARDPRISAALEKLGRAGVPVYAVYRPGEPPRLLPAVLTPGLLAGELRK